MRVEHVELLHVHAASIGLKMPSLAQIMRRSWHRLALGSAHERAWSKIALRWRVGRDAKSGASWVPSRAPRDYNPHLFVHHDTVLVNQLLILPLVSAR